MRNRWLGSRIRTVHALVIKETWQILRDPSVYLIAFALPVALLFLFGALSFGLLLSIITRNQLLASQMAIITTVLPAFLLSGFIFPLENMPMPIQWTMSLSIFQIVRHTRLHQGSRIILSSS